MLTLAGVNDENLVELSKQTGAKISLRGDTLSITGSQEAVNRAAPIARRMIDTARKTDLTAERTRVLSAVKFDQLPLDLAFRKVQGNGARKIAYFTDPNCPYCKKLEPDLAKLDNVTIYIFLYPVLGPDSHEKAKAVWCAKDRVKVWDEWMLKGQPPKTAGTCDTPIEKILAFGRRKGITGTPTMFLADGERVKGAIPIEQLKKLVDGSR